MERTIIKDWFQLPDISHSLPFYRIMQVGTGLRRCLVQPPAQNRVSYEMRKNYSVLCVCWRTCFYHKRCICSWCKRVQSVCMPPHARPHYTGVQRSIRLLASHRNVPTGCVMWRFVYEWLWISTRSVATCITVSASIYWEMKNYRCQPLLHYSKHEGRWCW